MTEGPLSTVVSKPEDMVAIAKDIVSKLHAGDVLLLSGDLGAGKTTFTQALAIALGVTTPVTSPTFTIMGEYEVKGRDDILWLVHIDLYRIPADQHGVDQGYISEVIDEAKEHKRVVVIEWPEKLALTVAGAWQLTFAYGASENERTLSIIPPAV